MRLKPIPANTVIHTPTEEEAKELLAILHENGYSVSFTLREIKKVNGYKGEEICFRIDGDYLGHCTKDWFQKKRNPILTLAEFKERYVVNEENFAKSEEEKPQPDLNLGELLKGHENENIYSLLEGETYFKGFSTAKGNRCPIQTTNGGTYTIDGRYFSKIGTCVLFPSRALYEEHPLDPLKAWSVWQEEHKCHIEVTVNNHNNDGDLTGCAYVSGDITFRIPADRDKCIEEIKSIIEKYSKK